jgi:hypothetical protein
MKYQKFRKNKWTAEQLYRITLYVCGIVPTHLLADPTAISIVIYQAVPISRGQRIWEGVAVGCAPHLSTRNPPVILRHPSKFFQRSENAPKSRWNILMSLENNSTSDYNLWRGAHPSGWTSTLRNQPSSWTGIAGRLGSISFYNKTSTFYTVTIWNFWTQKKHFMLNRLEWAGFTVSSTPHFTYLAKLFHLIWPSYLKISILVCMI